MFTDSEKALWNWRNWCRNRPHTADIVQTGVHNKWTSRLHSADNTSKYFYELKFPSAFLKAKTDTKDLPCANSFKKGRKGVRERELNYNMLRAYVNM